MALVLDIYKWEEVSHQYYDEEKQYRSQNWFEESEKRDTTSMDLTPQICHLDGMYLRLCL